MPRNDVTSLAVAIASGRSVAAWRRDRGVPSNTAYRLASSPECQKLVAEIRRRAIDQAVGKLTKAAVKAVDRLVKLADSGTSEAVQLQAARAILSELIAVETHAKLSERLLAIEERLNERSDATGSS
jgi:hypothetical protein